MGHPDTLRCNESLVSGTDNDRLVSFNGAFSAIVQTDGNFCIYTSGTCTWASNTWHKGTGPYKLVQQADGNFCLYDKDGHCTWAGNGAWQPHDGDKNYTRMQDDGNLVVRNKDDKILWQSGSATVEVKDNMRAGESLKSGTDDDRMVSVDQSYAAIVQTDGNFCIYKSGTCTWASHTWHKGPGPYSLHQQNDGNLCLYDRDGKCTWAANGAWVPSGGEKNVTIMQNDGNMVVYDGDKKALWASNDHK